MRKNNLFFMILLLKYECFTQSLSFGKNWLIIFIFRRGDILPGREIRHPLDDGYDMGYGAGSVSGSSRYDHQQPGPSGMGPGRVQTSYKLAEEQALINFTRL